jgi:transposase
MVPAPEQETDEQFDLQALVKVLKRAGVERICLEATGTYHLDLALALEAAGLAVMVVNPQASKRFAAALAYLTFQQQDACGIVAYDDETRVWLPARGGTSIGTRSTTLIP